MRIGDAKTVYRVVEHHCDLRYCEATMLLRRTKRNSTNPSMRFVSAQVFGSDRTLPRVIPTKNIAASNTTITPSFRGGLSLRICLSKSSWSYRSILMVPNFVRAKRGNIAPVPLTVAEQTLGSSLKWRATHCSMMHWPSIQKDEASISTGLRKAAVCRSLGAVLQIPTRAEQPFGTIVDA